MDDDRRERVRVTLRYQGITYTYVDELLEGSADYMYTDGNFGCDCNKSLFIARYCDPAFTAMMCGDEIELVSLEPTEENASTVLNA